MKTKQILFVIGLALALVGCGEKKQTEPGVIIIGQVIRKNDVDAVVRCEIENPDPSTGIINRPEGFFQTGYCRLSASAAKDVAEKDFIEVVAYGPELRALKNHMGNDLYQVTYKTAKRLEKSEVEKLRKANPLLTKAKK